MDETAKKADGRRKIAVGIGIAAALMVLGSCLAVLRRPAPPTPAIEWTVEAPGTPAAVGTPLPPGTPGLVRSIPAAHPHLILNPANLAQAQANAITGTTKIVYDTISYDANPLAPSKMADNAFLCLVNPTACSSGGWGTNTAYYLNAFVTTAANDATTVWAPISNTSASYVAGMEYTTAVALAYDWLYAGGYLSATYKWNACNYLLNWVNTLHTWLDARSFENNNVAPVAAGYGLAMMAISGDSCAPSLTTDIQALVVKFDEDIYGEPAYANAGVKAGGQWQEGLHYGNTIALGPVTTFTAAAVENSFMSVPAAAERVWDWYWYGGISGSALLQYGDAIAADSVPGLIWPQSAWNLRQSGDVGQYWAFERYFPTTNAITVWVTSGHTAGGKEIDQGGRPLFVTYFDNSVSGSTGSAAKATFLRERAAASTGGIAVLRDGWSGETVVSFMNRYDAANHQHYDYNSVTLAQAGVRQLVDHTLYKYATANHGKNCEHSTVLVNGSCLSANSVTNNTADDSTAYGTMERFLTASDSSVAIGDARYAITDVIKPVGAGGGYYALADVHPVTKAQRMVVQSAFLSTPVYAVFDDYSVSGALSLTLRYEIDSGATVAGTGAVATPVTITQGGQTLNLVALGAWTFDGSGTLTGDSPGDGNSDAVDVKYVEHTAAASSAQFASLLVPATSHTPRVVTDTLGGRTAYSVTLSGSSDALAIIPNPTGATVTIGSLSTDAEGILLGYHAGALTWGAFAAYTSTTYGGQAISAYTTTAVALVNFTATSAGGYSTDDNLRSYAFSFELASPTATPTPTRTPTVTPTPTATPVVSLVLNEICPLTDRDTNGDGAADVRDRFVELYSATGSNIPLVGWTLAITNTAISPGSPLTYTFPAATQFSGGYKVIYGGNLGFTLPLSGTAALRNAGGTLYDAVTYPAQAVTNTCYARVPSGGSWTTGYTMTVGTGN